MLPGPATRSNFGAADCSSTNLLAYAAGSTAAILDPKSMQLISLLPMPSTPLSPAPFITALRWAPPPLPLLSAGDRQGRIALWDLPSRSILLFLHLHRPSNLAIQDLCWLRSDDPNSPLLAAIHGPSLLAIFNTSSGQCLFKYDAGPEYLSCIRRDPFDLRRFCVLGLGGLLLSGVGGGPVKEYRVKGEFEGGCGKGDAASADFPGVCGRMCFLEGWRDVVAATFGREIVVFDLGYGEVLSCVGLARGCGRFLDLVADPDLDLVYGVHVDGRLSVWKRKE